jgi:hypothetical protein
MREVAVAEPGLLQRTAAGRGSSTRQCHDQHRGGYDGR